VAYCPHCGNDSPQQVVTYYNRFRGRGEWSYYHLVFCQTCEAPLLYYCDPKRSKASERFTLKDKELLWPLATSLHHAVPPRIREVYEEAARVKRRAPNAFANQIRRSLEALCRDRGANGRSLNDCLRQLAANGEIPAVLAEMTDVLRLFGNMGSHDDDLSVAPVYVDVIDDFFRAIVEHVYVAPYRVNEVRSQLESARRAAQAGA
jgi:hypothetical protein